MQLKKAKITFEINIYHINNMVHLIRINDSGSTL